MDIEQARTVDMIQAKLRKPFASKRQEQNPEARKLRRARIANYSQQIVEQERNREPVARRTKTDSDVGRR